MKNSFLKIFPVLAVLIASPSFAGESIGEPATVWNQKTIRVCWGSMKNIFDTVALERFDEKSMLQYWAMSSISDVGVVAKAAVQKIITREYNQKSIGIEFKGWKDCGEKTDGIDVVLLSFADTMFSKLNDLLSSELPYGRSTIGNAGSYIKAGYGSKTSKRKPYVLLRLVDENEGFKITPVQALQITALHEFGHLLGLRHEHARKEAWDDVNCKRTETYSMESTDQTTAFYGKYDPNSIMNYCYTRMLKDKVGLRFLVGKKNAFSSLLVGLNIQDSSKINFADPSLMIKKTLLGWEGISEYRIKIGISQGDRHALRCLYDFYSDEEAKKSCHE